MKAINNVLACKISRFKLNIGQLRLSHTMRQIAATRRHDRLLQQIASCDVKIIVATTELCHCDLLHKFKPCDRSQQQNKRKQPFHSVCTCDKSQWQNLNQPMRDHQLEACHVKFELVYISSFPKSIACTEQVSYCSDLSQYQCRRGDLSRRCVALCVSAFVHVIYVMSVHY